ncbi:hypothetical protein DFH09DRAFT_935537 [Mycena vulgaris]|nr:hypothetical protein DFH09DRAFT_935537 [Mycena vulgaris]
MADPPRNSVATLPPEIPPKAAGKRRRPTVEEVEDEDARWEQDFPEERRAGAILEECKTQFEKLRESQKAAGQEPWYPFESEEEWELARWLMTSGLSQSKTDDYLKLKMVRTVREGINPSFHNNRAFLKHIDALPDGPGWFCHPFELTGDELDADEKPKKEIVEMWYRDPLECVKELLGNPAFTKQGYVPRRIFKNQDENEEGVNREYSEMWTADWWWKIQELLPIGSTLCPIILSSDKTQLTRFSGDQQAWPVYLTIGNIDKETRRTPSSRATVLIGYIPVTKLEIFMKVNRSAVLNQLFHDCMRVMLEPLKTAGTSGVRMECADGILWEQSHGAHPPEFKTHNLCPINPFWADLPHCDIFSCMTPDILHEGHNGVFGDHIVSWSSAAISGLGPEIDLRFRAMAPHPTLRHFKKGISLTTQWTGNEHKNMEKVYLGILANATEPAVQRAVGGVIDFIYYAHFETHCDESLAQMDAAWAAFHANKDIFKILDIRDHFDIIKVHKLKHYTDSIRSRGTADGYNTENTERLHIDLAKVGYKATNKKAYTRQMTVWLARQEAVHKFGSYLQWAVPGYIAKPAADDNSDDEDEVDSSQPLPEPEVVPQVPDESDDEGELEEPRTVRASVPVYAVAKKPGFPNLTVASILTDFQAPDFLYHLERFLESKSIAPTIEPSEASIFPVYKRLSLPLPTVSEVTSHEIGDKIRAVKGEPLKLTPAGVKPAKPGQFDTILVRTHVRADGETPTDGLRVARVRVIFRLPEQHGTFPDPLAYIDWYTSLGQPIADIRMHQVTPSSRNHQRNSEVIPITDIVRSCHLIPVFGRSVDPTWTSDRVLDQAKSFYLNPYLRHHDFYLFRYLVDVHTAKKAEAQRRVRIRQLGRAGRH